MEGPAKHLLSFFSKEMVGLGGAVHPLQGHLLTVRKNGSKKVRNKLHPLVQRIYLFFIPASCSRLELRASLLAKIGLPYRAANWRSVPKNPGMRKSNNDHNSKTLF